MQVAAEGVGAAAGAQLQNLGEREEEGGFQTRFDRRTDEQQWAKMREVVEVAEEIWGK